MDYISTTQAAQKWGISANRVFKLIRAGRIPGAVKLGSMWMIPESIDKPIDGRTQEGKAAAAARAQAGDVPFRYPVFEHLDPASFDPALTSEELQIKAVQEEFHACRFEEADELLANLPDQASDRYCRISALYLSCMIDIMLGRTVAFANHYERLFAETQMDFPHKREMEEYVHLVDATLGNEYYYLRSFHIDPNYCYHESFLPRLAMLAAYPLSIAQNRPTAADLNAHELNCKLFKDSHAYGDLQTLHLYLGTGYAFMEDFEHADRHFASALEIAEKYELYYNITTHYLFWSQFVDPTLRECAQDIRLRIAQLSADVQERYLGFMEKASLNSIYTLLPKGDYALLYYAVHGHTNKEVAKILHISPSTVGKRYSKICATFGVSGKRDLVAFYHSTLSSTTLDATQLSSVAGWQVASSSEPSEGHES